MCQARISERLTQPPVQLLTRSIQIDSLAAERSLFGENRGIDRILRRLKLHAEGRQFGGEDS
jgi:hypothetical protein